MVELIFAAQNQHMRKLLLVTAAFMAVFNADAQITLQENFNYVAGSELTGNGWTQIGTSVVNPIAVSNTGLSFPGYPLSGEGLAVSLNSTGQDIYKDGTASISTGSVYCSFILNVGAAQASGDYFFALLPTTSSTNFTGRVFVKQNGSNISIGVAKSTEAVAYSPVLYNLNTSYLVIVRYDFNTGGGADDQIALHVLNASAPAMEPVPVAVTAGTAGDAASIGRVALRQGSAPSGATVTVDGIRMAGTWNDAVILALDLISFEARPTAQGIVLNWLTANEKDNMGFEVEKSLDGTHFTNIGFVAAKGSQEAAYSFTDESNERGYRYYRLKQLDFDGSFSYSRTLKVTADQADNLVFSNPVYGAMAVSYNAGAEAVANIRVTDAQGRTVLSAVQHITHGQNHFTLDMTRLPSGTYQLHLISDKTSTSRTFIRN
ncbi:MAG: T9SS type A sorting domain-containing protein [Sphingobacteriales bacterium]|nr:MAG: T9SS type A sorting domain-containing protein [Sphingobacteriales bacterium]